MAKKILEGTERTLLNMNGSDYILIESAMKKIMGLEDGDKVKVDLWWSNRHQSYYFAGYLVKKEDQEANQS